MTRVNIQSASSIVQRMINRVVARSALTDVSPASALMQVLGATSVELELCYLELAELLSLFSIDTARGADLDALAKLYLPDAISRRSALNAFGSGAFTLVSVATAQVVIPAGARLRNPSSGQEYRTLDVATIDVGQNQSNRVSLRAVTAGESGNTPSGTITEMLSGAPVNGFLHTGAALGGRNLESDQELRARIRARVQALSRSTPAAIEARALDARADGRAVISARLIEDETDRGFCLLYIDDGTTVIDDFNSVDVTNEIIVRRAQQSERVYFAAHFPIKRRQNRHQMQLRRRQPSGALSGPISLIEGRDFEMTYSQGRIVLSPDIVVGEGDELTLRAYTYQTGLIAATQRLIEGDPFDTTTPAYRAAGVVIEVVPAEKRLVSVSCSIVVNDGFDRTAVLSEVRSAISNYINTLPIGGDVVVSALIEQAMSPAGMYDVILNSPSENIAIAYNQVARALFDEIEVQ